jgi:pimeloyl-ACP methyl ester carboxylesterase
MNPTLPRRAYADGPFGQIHYRFVGNGPALLMFHQAPMTSGQFDSVYGPLAAHGLQVIGVDMPGFGMSDPTDFVPRVEDYAQVAPAVLDALGLQKAVMLGHHTGALVATEAVLQFPERATGLVLAGPLPMTEGERENFLATITVKEKAFEALPGGQHLADMFKTRERMAAGSVPLHRLSDYVIQALSGRGTYWHGHHAAFQYRQELSLLKVTHPALIITNTGDLIYEQAQRARALRPDFAYAELEGGGVDIVDQQPEAWSALVADFVLALPNRKHCP